MQGDTPLLLTNVKCETAAAKIKPYKLNDGNGLYLHVMPTGRKYWRLKYSRCAFYAGAFERDGAICT